MRHTQRSLPSFCLATLWVLVFYSFTILCSGRQIWAQTQQTGLLTTVVIDAGHGGKDPGTEGKHSKEKNVTLAVALKLGKLIREAYPELKTLYTRETDEFIELNQRANIANEAKADLFISIHCNAAKATAASGSEVFVMGLHTSKSNLEVAQRENSVISYEDDYSTKYEGYDPKSPESFMIFSLMQNVFLDQSLAFASDIQNEFVQNLQRKDRGVKQAGFLVLYKSGMPSVLIELGFLSNPQEEKYLLSENGQEELAKAIFKAFTLYKKKWDEHATQTIATNKSKSEKKQDKKTETAKNNVQQKDPDGRIFRIQLATLTNPIAASHRLRKQFPDLKERKEGKFYRYYTHEYLSLEDAKKDLAEVKKSYSDAFIVAFIGDKKVSF